MSTKPNRRELIEQWLREHPHAADIAPAAACGVCGAATGFGMGLALDGFALAMALALICAVVGAITGYFLGGIGLMFTFIVLILVYPSRWWFPVLAVGVAATAAINETLRPNSTLLEILLILMFFLVLSSFAIEISYGLICGSRTLYKKLFRPQRITGGRDEISDV